MHMCWDFTRSDNKGHALNYTRKDMFSKTVSVPDATGLSLLSLLVSKVLGTY